MAFVAVTAMRLSMHCDKLDSGESVSGGGEGTVLGSAVCYRSHGI